MNPVDPQIARIAAAQYGVFTYDAVLRSGATKRVIERRLASGRWERLHQGVYRLSGTPGSWRQQVIAACFAAGSAVASHRAAGGLWRVAGFEQRVLEITVPRGRRPRLHGVIVHQLSLPSVDVTILDAIPITTPARTLLDLAAVSPTDAVEEALDDALRRGLTTRAKLRWRVKELGRRSGSRAIRTLLDVRNDGARTAQSVLKPGCSGS